jgi:hypothetical protein
MVELEPLSKKNITSPPLNQKKGTELYYLIPKKSRVSDGCSRLGGYRLLDNRHVSLPLPFRILRRCKWQSSADSLTRRAGEIASLRRMSRLDFE